MGEIYFVSPEGKYEKVANVVGSYPTDGGNLIVRHADLILGDEVTFNVKLSKNDCKRMIRMFGMKRPQLVGRRIAKRKNRLRRLNNWKKMAAERARFYNLPLAEKYRYLITHAVDTVKNGIIDTGTDCVGIIKGMEWGGYRHE